MKHRFRKIAYSLLAVFCLSANPRAAKAEDNVAKKILKLTGGVRTKIVFSRRIWDPGESSDSRFNADKTAYFDIMVFDTDEGRERVLIPKAMGKHPMITPSGERVIFDNYRGSPLKIYVVDWDGRNRREICDGTKGAGVAQDPAGVEWVYYLDVEPGGIWRRKIDDPAKAELVWDKTPAGGNWALTRDGKRGVAGLPWPNVCVVDLPNGNLVRIRWRLRRVAIPGRYVDFKTAPDCAGRSVYFPAWVRYNERLITFTGPQREGNDPGQGACVIMGKFNKAFTKIEEWVRITVSPTWDNGAYALLVPPGANAATSDAAWMKKNKFKVKTMQAQARNLKLPYERTAAWKATAKVLDKYGISVE